MSCEEIFYKKLRERGLRLTPQREIVLSVLHQLSGMVTAEEIYEKVKMVSSSIDISTVYRTLDLFQHFHLVVSVDPGDGQRLYELVGTQGPHLYLVCRGCGKIQGAELAPVRPLAEHLEAQYGFEAELEHLSIPGLCQACRESASQE